MNHVVRYCHAAAAQVEFESEIEAKLKAVDHILV
jgi:hypothetical protein